MAVHRSQFPKTINVSNLPLGLFVLVFWILVALIFAWTGTYTVPAESEGIVQRFGAYHQTVKAGLQFKIPYGVDKVTIVPVRRQLKMEFGFEARGTSKDAPPELRSILDAGTQYQWRVARVDANGEEVDPSAMKAFSLR